MRGFRMAHRRARSEESARAFPLRVRAEAERDESNLNGRDFLRRRFFVLHLHQRCDGGRVRKISFLLIELFEEGLNARIMRKRCIGNGAAVTMMPDRGEDISNGSLCGGAAGYEAARRAAGEGDEASAAECGRDLAHRLHRHMKPL